MINQFTYLESKSTKWLTAVFLAFSCFSFSMSPVPADARKPLPTQIEQVVSSRDERVDSVEYQKIAVTACSFHSVNRSKEHEKNVLLNYQNKMKVHFEHILQKLHSFRISDHYQYPKIIPLNSDEEISPSVLV